MTKAPLVFVFRSSNEEMFPKRTSKQTNRQTNKRKKKKTRLIVGGLKPKQKVKVYE